MSKYIFLEGNKYKFFLGFHIFIVALYSIFMIIAVVSYNSPSDFKFYMYNIQETIFKYSFYLVINLISIIMIYRKAKLTKIILNIFAALILILVCFALYTLIKSYSNNSYYNFVIVFNTLIIIFIIFYISYLNNNKVINNSEIEEIGKHK